MNYPLVSSEVIDTEIVKPRLYDLDKILGHVGLTSRWVPCGCGRGFCGYWMNRKREYGRYGQLISDKETTGVGVRYDDCDGKPHEPTLSEKASGWFSRLMR